MKIFNIKFSIEHVTLDISCNNKKLFAQIQNWSTIFHTNENSSNSSVHIKIKLYDNPESYAQTNTEIKDMKFFSTCNNIKYYTSYNKVIAEFGKLGLMVLNLEKNNVCGWVKIPSDSFSFSIDNYMTPVYELFRKHKLFPIHSGAVTTNNIGILIPGKSGMGKSTLSLDLVYNGFSFISDDRCILSMNENGYNAIGFREPVRYFGSNLSHIDLDHIEKTPSTEKQHVDFNTLYPHLCKPSCHLKWIVFPQWSSNEISRLELLTQGQSLKELLPLTMICFNKDTSKKHFDFICQLLENTKQVKLIMGKDRNNWNILIKNLINRLEK